VSPKGKWGKRGRRRTNKGGETDRERSPRGGKKEGDKAAQMKRDGREMGGRGKGRKIMEDYRGGPPHWGTRRAYPITQLRTEAH